MPVHIKLLSKHSRIISGHNAPLSHKNRIISFIVIPIIQSIITNNNHKFKVNNILHLLRDKMFIGVSNNNVLFKNDEKLPRPNDLIYLYTDGY